MRLYFFQDSNDFSAILKDPTLRKHIITTVKWPQHLYIELHDDDQSEKISSYVMLKFGDMILKQPVCPDRTPIPGKDYSIRWPEDYTGPRC